MIGCGKIIAVGILVAVLYPSKARALTLESSIAATRSAFVQTYRASWQSRGMEKKLGRIVKTSVHDQTKDFMWGTRSVRLLFNQGHVVDRIQADISNGFSDDYDRLLASVEESFAEDFQKLLVSFYQKAAASAVSEAISPFEKAFIRQSSSILLEDRGTKLTEQLNREVSKKYPRLILSGTAIGIGLTTTFFRDRLASMLVQKLGVEALTKGIGKKLISTAVPVFGVFMTAWGAFDFIKMAYHAEDQLAKTLQKGYCGLYSNEAPEQFWLTMKDIVQETFEQAQANIVLDQTRAKELSENEAVLAFTEHLSKNESIRFAERLACISREIGIEVNDDEFINRFGVIVRSLSDSQFRKFLLLLTVIDPFQLKGWLQVTSVQELMELSGVLPKAIWSQYAPGKDALMTLTWVASSLPNASRNAVAKISAETLNWVRNELPIRYAMQLLKVGVTAGEIEQEVRRLKALPKNKRQPWQSDGSYAVSRLVSICKWLGIVFITLMLILVLFRLYWYFFGINAMRKPVTFEPYGQEFPERERRTGGIKL
ncbi:hypothetical protein [Pyramidobacter sp.]|uniref:hypothetical protein n=1 Tax=Pyramidobacter sp. TaxID=1943581 RepID=UPI003318C8DD